jgi:hypothetical protein
VLGNIHSDTLALELLSEMGVNRIITYYPFNDDFTAGFWHNLHGMKILNYSWPGEAFKYLEAQNRDIDVWRTASPYVNDDGSSWGDDVSNVIGDSVNIQVLQMQQQLEGTMWRPQSDLGVMNGWRRREAFITWDVYMKMHYRITCNLVPNGTPPGTQEVATFYWFVKNTEGAGWWRYPGQVLTVNSFQNGPDSLDVMDFAINPAPDSAGTFTLVDDDFEETPPTETATSHAYGDSPLDETQPYHGFSSQWGVPVRMSVFYHGHNQTFQIYNVQIWDEGYHKLFVNTADTTNFYAALRTAFQNQYNAVGDTVFAGWYYDEWPQGPTMHQYEPVKSFVKVNQILQGHVPTMVVNGHQGYPGCQDCYRNYLFGEENNQGVTLPVHMDEFYFLGGSNNCHDNWEYNYTDFSSDVTYLDYQNCERSLQCAIDQYIWGDSALVAGGYGLTPHFDYANSSLLAQVSFVHDDSGRGAKFWSLIQGDDDAADDDTLWSSIRTPSPNETKLGAWLSVACDVDGILWYPMKFGAGLLKWEPDSADICDSSRYTLADGPADVDTTDGRYSAAKKVCNDIQRIAPILEPLTFVSTSASRAFNINYPDSSYESTQRDILATDCDFWGTPYRSVPGICAYAPDGNGWSETAEDYPYVQVSRFRNPNVPLYIPDIEDYWFLIVNRRGLDTERRKIRVTVDIDSAYMDYPYYVDYILGDSTKTSEPGCVERILACSERFIDVILEPGEAELVNFYRSELGCPDTVGHVAARVDSVTAKLYAQNSIMLRWAETTQKDELPFITDTYFIYGSLGDSSAFVPLGFSTTTSYVDSLKANRPRYYYMVEACGDYAGE